MASFLRNTTRLTLAAGFALLAGCAQLYPPPAPPAVAYNPPGTALAALSANDVTRYHVNFATDSYRIDADGRAAIDNAAALMQGNAALTVTIIGSADPAGSDASNMRLL
jgi:outer membrane protein OmpA-like peptidoglycan-associated protein